MSGHWWKPLATNQAFNLSTLPSGFSFVRKFHVLFSTRTLNSLDIDSRQRGTFKACVTILGLGIEGNWCSVLCSKYLGFGFVIPSFNLVRIG